ncbi:MAG: hypothetical protein QG577_1414, partial [Thermodesulfobacteriota bacterium]|nr:hypothetical protein [Thermodesulfobacteriota bacterium]
SCHPALKAIDTPGKVVRRRECRGVLGSEPIEGHIVGRAGGEFMIGGRGERQRSSPGVRGSRDKHGR